MLLCIIINGCKDLLSGPGAVVGRQAISAVNLQSCVRLLTHLVRLKDKSKVSANHVRRMHNAVGALLQNKAVEQNPSLQSSALVLHGEVFEHLMQTEEQLQMLTELVNRGISNKATDSEYKLLILLLQTLPKPLFVTPFANAPGHVSALIHALLEWWPHLSAANVEAGPRTGQDIKSTERTIERAVLHLYTLLSCKLFARLFHQIGHRNHPLEHINFWTVTSKIIDKSIDSIAACADEDWEGTGLVFAARRCALLPVALGTLGNAYMATTNLSKNINHRSTVLEQIPRLLTVTAAVLLKKTREQDESSPTALWMFNVRHLAISVTVKFMSLCMSITGTTHREHLIKETLQHPILQRTEVYLEPSYGPATDTTDALQQSFLDGLRNADPYWHPSEDLIPVRRKYVRLGERMAAWCRNTTGVDLLLDPLLRSFFAAAIVRSF